VDEDVVVVVVVVVALLLCFLVLTLLMLMMVVVVVAQSTMRIRRIVLAMPLGLQVVGWTIMMMTWRSDHDFFGVTMMTFVS
jgi:hypothetical protein